MCLYDTLTSCQDDFPVLLIVTALKYAEIFRLCSTIPNYYPSWILCIKDSNWFSLMLLIRVEYFCQNNLKSMNIWLEKRPSKSSRLFFVLDYFCGLFVHLSERGQVQVNLCDILVFGVTYSQHLNIIKRNLPSLVPLTNHIFRDVKMIIDQTSPVPSSNWQVMPPTLDIRFPTSFKCAYLKPVSLKKMAWSFAWWESVAAKVN